MLPAKAPSTPQAKRPISGGWEDALAQEALRLLAEQQPEVWAQLAQRFETVLIQAALGASSGRRMEAAQKLGMGRNTLTRKMQELKLG